MMVLLMHQMTKDEEDVQKFKSKAAENWMGDFTAVEKGWWRHVCRGKMWLTAFQEDDVIVVSLGPTAVLFSKKGERGLSMPPSLSRVDDYKAVKKAKASSDTEASNSTVASSREEVLSIANGTEARVQDC
ncbi:hypothetical protein MHYP_G00139220 [Metynnis hypsauchen]